MRKNWKAWAHHPRGGHVTGFASYARNGERRIAPTLEEARSGFGMTFPVSQVHWGDPPDACQHPIPDKGPAQCKDGHWLGSKEHPVKGAEKPAIEKLPDSQFRYGNAASSHRVFLFEVDPHKPGCMRPLSGWKIVGYGKAPWPGTTDGFAVMFEKVEPAIAKRTMFDRNDLPIAEGTRIWHHYQKKWLK
jgi:hypothetical protein